MAETIGKEETALVVTDRILESVTDTSSGDLLAHWPDGAPSWYVQTVGDYTPISPGLPTGRRSEQTDSGGERLTLDYERAEAPRFSGRLTIETEPDKSWVSLSLQVTNQGEQELDIVGFPGNLRVAKGPDRHLVFPLESGVLLPLDERLAKMKIYNVLPFVFGYPGNRASMQWMGVQDGGGSGLMLMHTDRYGGLKRMGILDDGEAARLVVESHAGLAPGETMDLPAWRLEVIPRDGQPEPAYQRMAAIYREWVQERSSLDGNVLHDTVDGVEKIPLQFVGLKGKRLVRPHLDSMMQTHGYPEHVMREHGDTPMAYVAYGKAAELMRSFEEVYGSKITPQLWSFSRSSIRGGWPLFPLDPKAEAPIDEKGIRFPGLALGEFLQTLRRRDDTAVLYVNPTFWGTASENYDPQRMFDETGVGNTAMGGFAAQASADSAYVSPSLVAEEQVAHLGQLAAFGGNADAKARSIMFDSSQALGGTLFNNSHLRHDPFSIVDRNPAARYRERYGYLGRDSYVQDRLQRDVALHEATPFAAKGGEWISELTASHLDMNAGSIDLKREFPDTTPRPGEENLIPVPLFQMVFGDAQLFTIRVGAAADANTMRKQPGQALPAEMSRRATALFGGVQQAFFWGGIGWAESAYRVFRGRTYLVTRDNLARQALLGQRAAFRMLDAQGRPTVSNFALRETSWLDDEGSVVAVHWDNNSGGPANLRLETGMGPMAVHDLWGAPQYLPESLERMRLGATATLMRNGAFSLWSFAGGASWNAGHRVRVNDSQPTPEGLTVIWDGERLSIGNSAQQAREVTVECDWPYAAVPEPEPPLTLEPRFGASATTIQYQSTNEYTIRLDGDTLVVRVALPGAAAPSGHDVPTTIVTFTRQP